MKAKFWAWVLTFGAAGLLIPITLLVRYYGIIFGEWEARLWPTSLLLMGLDAPDTTTAIAIFAYALALITNILKYGLVGVVTWPVAHLILWLRSRNRAADVR